MVQRPMDGAKEGAAFLFALGIGKRGGGGIEVAVLARKERVLFVVKSLKLDYRHPAKLSNALQVSVVLQEIHRVSLDLWQEITYDNLTLCSGSLRLACLDADTLRPRRIPETLIEEL